MKIPLPNYCTVVNIDPAAEPPADWHLDVADRGRVRTLVHCVARNRREAKASAAQAMRLATACFAAGFRAGRKAGVG